MSILNAADVAHYFLANQDASGINDRITNLKVQKLCYYAQGFALVKLQQPLFFEDIEHWQHGPVIPTLWREYRRFGSGPIPTPAQPLNLNMFGPDIRRVLDDVIDIYGSLTAWELRNMTHAEPPWVATPDGSPITHQKIRVYFGTLVKDMEASRQSELGNNESQSLAAKMANDAKFRELTERGLADLSAGRYSKLDEVRRSLGSL